MSKEYVTIEISNLPIKLGQFLKLAELVQDGFEAKIRIQEGEVMVNGVIETRRGRQLVSGETITLGQKAILIKQKS